MEWHSIIRFDIFQGTAKIKGFNEYSVPLKYTRSVLCDQCKENDLAHLKPPKLQKSLNVVFAVNCIPKYHFV